MSSELDQAGADAGKAGAEKLEQASWPPSREAIRDAASAAAAAGGTSICAAYGLGPASPVCGMIAGAAAGWITDHVLGFLWSVVEDPSFSPVLAESNEVMAEIDRLEHAADRARDVATNTLEALYAESFGELSGLGAGGWAQELATLGVPFTPRGARGELPWDPDLGLGNPLITQFVQPGKGVTPFARSYLTELRKRLPEWLEQLQRATVLEALHVLGLASAERAEKTKELAAGLKRGPVLNVPQKPLIRPPQMTIQPGSPAGDVRSILLRTIDDA